MALSETDKAAIRASVRDLMQRRQNAGERFLDYAGTRGLTREQSESALACLERHKLIKLNAADGQFSVKHGGFLDRDALLRAATDCPPVVRRKRQR